MKGYDREDKPQRPAPKIRITEMSEKKTAKRKQCGNGDVPNKKVAFEEEVSGEIIEFDAAPLSPVMEHPDTDFYKVEVATQTEDKSQDEVKRAYSSTKQHALKTVTDIQV